MRVGKRLLSLLCTAALLLSLGQGVLALEETTYVLTKDDCIVKDNEYGGVTIIEIKDNVAKVKTDLTIPAQLDGKAVTGFGTGEENKWLFPSSTALTRIRLPEGLVRIEGYAFTRCSNLTQVNLPGTLTSVGHHAFYLLSRLTSIGFNEGLTSIEAHAFSGTGLSGTLSLPDSVTTLGEHAFAGTKITAIGSLGGVVEWPAYLFSGCKSLTAVTVPGQVTSMGANLFSDCEKLETVTLPEGLATIADSTFKGCSALTSVTIPDTVTAIGNSVFQDNSTLKSITLPTGLTSLGNFAFSGCRMLTSIDVPDGVAGLGISAFEHCWTLREVGLPAGLKEVGSSAFNQCKVLETLTFPAGLEKLGVYHGTSGDTYGDVFGWTPALISVTFLGNKPMATDSPFAPEPSEGHHKNLTVYYPVGNDTYADWAGWTYPKVTTGAPDVPAAVDTAITLSAVLRRSTDGKNLELWLTTDVTPKVHPANSAFAPAGAINFTLDGKALPPPVQFVGGGSTLHQTVGYKVDDYIGKTIKIQALLTPSMGFNGSESNELTGLVIPKPSDDKDYPFVPGGTPSDPAYETADDSNGGVIITAIKGEMATRPTPVIPADIGGKPVTGLGAGLFANNSNTAYVTIPDSVKTLGAGVFQNCANLVAVSLPAALTEIPANTFSGCTNELSTVVLPGTIATIGANAFQNCVAMKEMTLPASLTTLNETAFSGCNLNEVTFEGNAPAFNGVGKTNFGTQTIYHLEPTATGFDATVWAGIRLPPVALGISADTPTFTIRDNKHFMELPINFDTTAYTGAENEKAKPDLSKVAVTLNGFPTYNLTVKEVTATGGVISVPIEKQFYGLEPFMWLNYPGDWYFNEVKQLATDHVQMPTPKEATTITAATAEVKDDNGILMLWVTPTITPENYFGQTLYRPSLSLVRLALDGQELTSGLQVVDGKVGAKIPGTMLGRTVPLTVTFVGDTRFAASALSPEGEVAVPGAEPVTVLNATSDKVYQDGQDYRLPLAVNLAIDYKPAGAPDPNRTKLSVTVAGQPAPHTAGTGNVLNVLVPGTLLDSTADVVVSYAGEGNGSNYTYKTASTTLSDVPLADPNPTPVNTYLTATAGTLTEGANDAYYLPLEVVLTHDPYKTTNYKPDRSDLKVTLDGTPANYTVGNDNVLNVTIPAEYFTKTVSIAVTYPDSIYFKTSATSLSVAIPHPTLTPAVTALTAKAGKLTPDGDGLAYYLPVETSLTHAPYGDTGYTPSLDDLKVKLNATENIAYTIVDGFIRIPISADLFFTKATIVLTYPGNAYFKPSTITLRDVEIPLPNAPEADTTLTASSSGKLLFVMAGSPGLAGCYLLPVTVNLKNEGYKGDSTLKPTLERITVTMSGKVVTDAVWSGSELRIPLVEAQYGTTVSIALSYPGEEHFNPSTVTIASVTISDPRTPSGGGGGSASVPKPPAGENAKVTVSNKDVTEAVKTAGDSGNVVLKTDTAENAESVTVTMSASVMKTIAKAESSVTIQSSVADLTLDTKVLETLQANGAKDVVVQLGAADTNALPKAAQSALAGRPVYDIAITAGGKSVAQFNGGSVTVTLPYTPAEGESPSGVVACWVGDDGSTEILQNSIYKDGKLSFSTPHLSTYAIIHVSKDFVDIAEDNWAKSDIDFAVARGILNGVGDNGMGGELFGPDVTLTGSMAVVALARMDGVADGEGPGWAYPALNWANEKNILPQDFQADFPLTREQFAYLVAGYVGGAKNTNAPLYLDMEQITSTCLSSVTYLTSVGLMNGVGDGCFGPKRTLTRAELTAVLHRIVVQRESGK